MATQPLSPRTTVSGAVATLARLPHMVDVFPIGAGFADWALWSA